VNVTSGRWEVCESIRFAGHCVVLRPGRYPSLTAMGLNDRVSSARSISRNTRIDDQRYAPAIVQGEVMAESLLHRHQSPFLLANLYSLAHWLGVLVEFWLMAAFLGQPLSFFQLLTIVITARLAFLTPLPAGLGVLESALPWVTAALGLGSVLGLSLCLLIRFRDILFSLAGLGLAMKYLTCPGKASTVAEKAG
jgi:uncharacterized membrane protein YbhN (UPF0104 family)